MSRVDVLKLKAGNRPVLFAVHGSGGLLSYGKIARYLDHDQPMYVVKGKELDKMGYPFRDLYDLAEQYVPAMLAVQPEGPYLICGRYSPIVIEVGQQLLSRGLPVALSMVFDMAPPEYTQKARRTLLLASYHWYKRLLLRGIAKTTSAGASLIRGRAGSRMSSEPDTMKNGTGLVSGRTVNDSLQANYLLKKYPAKVVYIQCMDFRQAPKKARHIAKWRAVADEVDVRVTPGGHSTMYEKPHVQILARIVQSERDKATASQASS